MSTIFEKTADHDQHFDLPADAYAYSQSGSAIPRDFYCGTLNDILHTLPEENAFVFCNTHFSGLETFCNISGRLATAIVKSTKWLNIVRNLVVQLHLDPVMFQSSDADRMRDLERMRTLIEKQFLVSSDVFHTDGDFAAYVVRVRAKRVIYVNDKLVSRLKDSTFVPSNNQEQIRYAILALACILAHECAHWLQAMVRPAHFFTDPPTYVYQHQLTPPTKLKGFGDTRFTDFGRMVETSYYSGSVTMINAKCPLTDLDIAYTINGVAVLVQKEGNKVDYALVTKEPVAFLAGSTYSDEGSGIIFPEATALAQSLERERAQKRALSASRAVIKAEKTARLAPHNEISETDEHLAAGAKRRRSGTTNSRLEEDSDDDHYEQYCARRSVTFRDWRGEIVDSNSAIP